MAAYDLMVIDDFGLMDLDIEKCPIYFEIIESRDPPQGTYYYLTDSSIRMVSAFWGFHLRRCLLKSNDI